MQTTFTSDLATVEAPTPNLRLDHLPDPGYDNHPAYGAHFPKPTFGMRLKAIKTLLPWIVVVMGKRAMLMDRIPAIPGYRGHLSGGLVGRLLSLPRYLPYVAKAIAQNVWLFITRHKPAVPAEHKTLTNEFLETGFGVGRLTDEELTHVLQLVEKPIASLREARAKAEKRTFEGNTRFFNTADDKELFDTLNRYFERHGMLTAAGAYIGRKVQITHLLIQINDPADSYFHGCFADVNLPDSKTNYMHVDTSYDMVKCAIYLNEVTAENGPFSYVLGSQRVRPVLMDGVIRRAVDRSGLSGFSPKARELFMALPKVWRKKCTFGADLLDGSPDQTAVLDAEYYLMSKDGNLGLFANNGVHRGGLTKSGERIVLFATIA